MPRRRISLTRQRELLRAASAPRGGALATNSHNFCAAFHPGPRRVYIGYRAQITGRGYQSAAWQVIGIDHKTDPGGHWSDYGHKTFNVYRRENSEGQRQAAITWATEQGYGTGWDRDPFGGYQTAETSAAYATWLAEVTT